MPGPAELLIVLAMLALPVLLVILVWARVADRPNGASRPERGPRPDVAPPASQVPLADRLTELEQARAAGLVTDDEYAARREKILSDA